MIPFRTTEKRSSQPVERVRVLLGGPPVRRPARVADARRRGASRSRSLTSRSCCRLPTARTSSTPAVDQREPGGVVAAVLETLEPGEQERLAGALPHVADDAADGGPPERRGSPETAVQAFPSSRSTRATMLPQRRSSSSRILVLDHHAHELLGARRAQDDAPGAGLAERRALALDDLPDRAGAGQALAAGAHVDEPLREARDDARGLLERLAGAVERRRAAARR